MPLGAAEQDRIAEEQYLDMEAAAGAPTYGREAVEKSAAQGEMEGLDVAAPNMVEATNLVRVVGSRTFVFSNEVWVDTGFDPDTMETVKVNFLSEDYFALVQSRTELGAAFALGSRVIVISEGIAYEIVGDEVQTSPVDIPPALEPEETTTESPVDTPVPNDPPRDGAPTNEPTSAESEPESASPCLAGLLPLLLLPIGLFIFQHDQKI
jgi:hypothetical protein